VFAPIAKWKAVCIVVALSTSNDWILVHLDVVTTFLNGDLKEIVYMEVPWEDFWHTSTKNKVCKFNKSLYGLHQLQRTWFEKINAFLLDQGLLHIGTNYSIFYVTSNKGVIILILYVDDLLVTSSNIDGINNLKQKLMSRSKMTDLGGVKLYLRVEFTRSNWGIFLSQKNYTTQILEKFYMTICHPTAIPI